MLPLRMLGLLMLMFLLCDADNMCDTDDNPLILDPPEIIGAYGESFTVNCSSYEKFHDGMFWKGGNINSDEVFFVVKNLSLSDWDVTAECIIKLESFECSKDLEITIYKTPDTVSVSAKDNDAMVEGREFQLNCDIINVAPVQKLKVKWYRGNEMMHTETFNGTSVTPVNVTSSFVVTPKRNYNETFFICVAELHLGPNGSEPISTESLPYIAIVHYKPLIQACPDHYTGVEDLFRMDMLPCKADGNPIPTLKWYYQGNQISAAEPLNRTHSGKYTAEFANDIGNSTTSINIAIEYGPSFTCNDHYEVQEGDEPQTVCEPMGMPKPSIIWFKDGKEMVTPQRWTKHDSGQYLLRATNKHGTANHFLHFDVLYAPEFKKNTHFENVSVVEGNNFTLTCEADGSPRPDFNWACDGVNILENANYLNLTRVMSNATYSCTATNNLGSITKQMHVHVIKATTTEIRATMTTPEASAKKDCPLKLMPSKAVVRFGDQASVNCSTSATDALGMGWEAAVGGIGFKNVTAVTWMVEKLEEWTIKPQCYITTKDSQCSVKPDITLYKTPDIVSVSAKDNDAMVEGREFQLNCDIINVAPVQKLKVKWYRGNEMMHTEMFNGTSVTPVNVTSSFVVTPKRNYNGTFFICVAELHLGPNGSEPISTESLPYIAIVHYKPLIQACADHYTGVEDLFRMDMLPCKADGNPIPTLKWYYQGNQISAAEPLNRTHSGKYTAEFANDIGNSTTSINIAIEYGPSFTCNDHYEVQEGDEPQTVCEPMGMPKPSIIWFKDGKEMVTPQRWTKHDSGQYLLRATNKHGTANHFLHFDVLYAPEFKKNTHFENVSVVEGNNFTLTCEADGSPRPDFNWACDGVNILENANYLNLTRVMSNATYSCTATNNLGSITKQMHVHVIKATTTEIRATMTTPEASAKKDCPLKLMPSKAVVRFGDQASVNCSTSATDALGMGWEAAVGGIGFKNVTAVTWMVEKLEEWTIKPQCYITTKDSQCSVKPDITLYKTPDIVSVSAKDNDAMVEGREFQLNCDIINVAPVQKLKVKWYRGNEMMHTEMFNGTSVTPVNVTSSFVVTPKRNYNGTFFICVAELHLGPNGSEPISTESLPYIAIVHYKPLIQACPDHYTGVEDLFRMDMLPCKADGNPIPTLKWYYQGNQISAAEPLNRTHSGKYTAEFANDIGNSTTSINIAIEYGPSFTCNDHYEVQEGDEPQTVCEPMGMPKPSIIWFKDGKEMVTPQRWTKHDSGQYLLRATNKHGTANHFLHFDVLYAPVFTQGNNTIMITPGENLTFGCHAVGNPDPVIHWNYTSAENVMGTTGGRQMNITVKGATSTNAAVYICVATNKVGSVTRSVRLIMKGENAQGTPKIWFIIPSIIVFIFIIIAIIYYKCQKKYGKYTFVPVPSSDIPLTTKS